MSPSRTALPREADLRRDDEQQSDVSQVEEGVVQHRAPDAVGLSVEPALRHAEEEKRDKGRIPPREGEFARLEQPFVVYVVQEREHRRRNDCGCGDLRTEELRRDLEEKKPEDKLLDGRCDCHHLDDNQRECQVPADVLADNFYLALVWKVYAEELRHSLCDKAKSGGR